MYVIGLCGTQPISDKSYFLSTSFFCILSLYYPLTFAPQAKGDYGSSLFKVQLD